MSTKDQELRDALRPDFAWLGSHRGYQPCNVYSDESTMTRIGLLRRAELSPALFDYQEDLITQALKLSAKNQSALLSLPTGGGKTRTAVVAVLRSLQERPRVVWLAPTIELVDQALDTFSAMWRELPSASDLYLTREFPSDVQGPCIWATTPHAVNVHMKGDGLPLRWDSIIFDEAHQMAAPMFKESAEYLQWVGRDQGAPAPLLGLSATPGRVDEVEGRELVRWFSRRLLTSDFLGENPVETLQQKGILAHLEFRRLAQDVARNDEVERIRIAARACRALVKRDRRVLVFTGSVRAAYILAEILDGWGIAAGAVDGKLDEDTRSQILGEFAHGRIHVVANSRLLATGYDCPAVSDVLLLSRVGSPILFEQMVGRAARGPRTGGWREATVWDFDDHLKLHGLPQAYYRYPDWNRSFT